jgi:uncharacterized DUF497 family protein
VSRDEATTAFNDPLALTFEDQLHAHDEYRFLTCGVSLAQAPLVLCHRERGGNIRILPARRMTPKERREHEQYR